MKKLVAALLISAAVPLAPAAAQVKTELAQPIAGTRLDIAVTGEVTRVPNLAIISAGVVTRSTTASGALQENSARMERVIAALKAAGVADRDIRNSGRILDALVAQGANQINGPTMTIEQPQAALDEARANAVAIGRARAELYARSLGKRVTRVISVSESGSHYAPPPPMPIAERGMAVAQAADTKIEPGEQKLQMTLAMVFELQ